MGSEKWRWWWEGSKQCASGQMNAATDTRYIQGLLNTWRYLRDYIGSGMFAHPA
jgi:hypothetical protein